MTPQITNGVARNEMAAHLALHHGIGTYLRSGELLNPHWTIVAMTAAVARRTGVKYQRGFNGLKVAFADLDALINALRAQEPQ